VRETELDLPWAAALRDAYNRRESALIILHNNIADIVPLAGEYVSSRRYLEHAFRERGYIIIAYDVSRGMRFADDRDAEDFLKLANENLKPGERIIRSIYDFPRESSKALAFIEAFVVGVEGASRPIAVLLDYAAELAPNGDPLTMSEADRINAVTLQRFAQLFHERLQDKQQRDAVCVLLTPNLHALNPALVRSEVVTNIEITRPGPVERARFIRYLQAKRTLESGEPLALEMSEEQLVELTSGLTLTGLSQLFVRAAASGAPSPRLDNAFVVARKRELIERDSRGMLEVLSPRHGLDAVGGHAAAKQFFLQTATDLREGRRDVAVGAICPGPNGVGKTFIAKAFARDSGVNCVILRNFRGMYVGQTESNLDTIFNILKAMTPNVVIIDEADKMLGNEVGDDSNKVDERVFGAFTAFMGDPDYRGKIFWLLLTARPFNLAPDTGRPGRAEEHVPILAPESFEDKKATLLAVGRACQVELLAPPQGQELDDALAAAFDSLGFVTPAALELIVNRARRRTRREAATESGTSVVCVPFELFAYEVQNFVPEGSRSKLLLQTLEAVLYTNHLAYLPEPWRSRLEHDPDGLAAEREALRMRVGYR
jgi:SpoVK/Ycf46/Vps4 family AAA+-type ATPase